MRRFLPVLVIGGLSGCGGDSTAPDSRLVPAEVKWAEWPAAMTSHLGESLRVVVYAPCGELRLAVETDTSIIRITAAEEVNLDGSCIGTGTGIYDSTFPMPQLSPSRPPEMGHPIPFQVRAPVSNYATQVLEDAVLGQLELTFQPPFVPRRAAAGRVRLVIGAGGCTWAAIDNGVFAPWQIIDAPPLDSAAAPYTAFFSGWFAAADPAECGAETGLALRVMQVDLGP